MVRTGGGDPCGSEGGRGKDKEEEKTLGRGSWRVIPGIFI